MEAFRTDVDVLDVVVFGVMVAFALDAVTVDEGVKIGPVTGSGDGTEYEDDVIWLIFKVGVLTFVVVAAGAGAGVGAA